MANHIHPYRFLLHPAVITSKNDGQHHYVNERRLARLYRVDYNECLCWDDFLITEHEDYVNLYVAEDGNYDLKTTLIKQTLLGDKAARKMLNERFMETRCTPH